MLILGTFSSYRIPDILAMPYAHFLMLFNMAESKESLNAIAVYTGRCMCYDNDTRDDILTVPRSKFKTTEAYKRIVTEDSKNRIGKLVEGKK